MQVCFIGHRKIEINEELISSLKDIVIKLINKGATTFLFGSMSEFDNLALQVVTELKNTYPFIKRVYVRSAFQYISEFYTQYLLESYDETYFPKKLENAGKYSYVERNHEMIDHSTYCIFYYNKDYIAPIKKQSKNDILPKIKQNSGTKIAYEYAIKKKKEIINLFNA